LQRLIPCRYYAINSPRTDQGTHHAAQGLLHRSSGTNCRRATAVGILSTLLAGVIAGMAMPPERHAAQPHPWLGGCRAQHPSKPTTQESFRGAFRRAGAAKRRLWGRQRLWCLLTACRMDARSGTSWSY
jgi:hypothetical protein